MDPLIVYEVYYASCRHEGGSVEGTFSTIERAREYALARVAERKRYREIRIEEDRRDDNDRGSYDEWTEEEPDVWGNTMEIVCITRRSVDSPEPWERLKRQLEILDDRAAEEKR